MSNLMIQKTIGKISKDKFNQLITGVLHIEEVPYPTYGIVNLEVCTKCKNNNPNTDCIKCTKDKFRRLKYKEKGAILLSERAEIASVSKVLSKYEILGYLYYHFCNISNNGDIAYVVEKEMAEAIGCKVQTIYNINKTLRKLGLIEFDRIGTGLITVHICNYEKSFTTSYSPRFDKDGNSLKKVNGFIELTLEWFKKVISLAKSTNALRLALYKTIEHDSRKIRNLSRDTYTHTMTFNEMKAVLQGKLCNKEIQLLINNIHELFDEKVEAVVVNIFALKKKYLSSIKSNRLKKACTKKYKKIFGELNDKQIKDLITLSNTYGIYRVIHIIKDLCAEGETVETIRNQLGLITSYMQDKINYNLARKLKNRLFEKEVACI